MHRVFINYRSGDEEASATLIERELSRRFGREEIFRASKSIPAGENFEYALLSAVRRCDLLLAVIGSRWLDAQDRRGGRALDDPEDWTRKEIAEAFAYGVTVVPVLIGSVERLPLGVLPEDIMPLERCQYRRLNHRNDDADIERLVETVVAIVPGLAGRGAQATETNGHDGVWNTVGGVRQGRDVTESRQGSVGDVAHNHGTVIGTANGPLHTGSGSQINGPQFTGDGVNYVAGDNKGTLRQNIREVENEGEGQ